MEGLGEQLSSWRKLSFWLGAEIAGFLNSAFQLDHKAHVWH